MAQEKSGLLIAALVAIVAIVGLVVLLRGDAQGAVVLKGKLGPDFGFPRQKFSSFEGNTYCTFQGVSEDCPGGIYCNNLQTGEEWCNSR